MRCALTIICLAIACLVGAPGCGRGGGGNIEKTADRFLTYLVGEDYTAATSLLETGYAKKLTPDRLKQSWVIFRRQVGEFKRERGVRTETDPSGRVVAITCEFEQRSMDLWLVFNAQGQITGLHFVAPGTKPSAPSSQPTSPSPGPQKKGAGGRIATSCGVRWT
jgi:hypothetical protein